MSTNAVSINPSHKAVKAYYESLKAYAGHEVMHETALRSAFQNLLAETGKARKWTLVPEEAMKVRGKLVRPDGTLKDDEWKLPRGYWEAKDTDDKLDEEIREKIRKGYPLLNTIFEDTRRGVLYQNGHEVLQADLTDTRALVDLLNRFYNHTERDIEGFEQAVAEFKDRIPHLAGGLLAKIEEAHREVPAFQGAFDGLMDLCKTALNPNIRAEAVDEMLVQHLLTVRLFERIFSNQDFIRRNVIAVEIEKVIDALTSRSFNRSEFLKSLNPFYKAIEDAARTIDDFGEKQHFLNTVYERFFQGYSVKVADTHGIVYTPQQVVDFMCASVEEVLKTEFGLGLGSPEVTLLDPCTGTGNFVVNLMRRIPKERLKDAYAARLFANEVMLLPYYIAAQNIEHEYYDITGEYRPFDGLCFVDTLELAEAEQGMLGFMTEANAERVENQKRAPINVIVGNPPYNAGQLNENDNNKNRKYEIIDKKIRTTYAKSSRATLNTKLYDQYVRFFRWAIDRLDKNDGILCFVTNNSFVHKIAFDGMRKHLMDDFTRLYHIDLKGDVKLDPELSGTAYNVFGIQVGVGITIAIKSSKHKNKKLMFCELDKSWRREKKLSWISEMVSLNGVKWNELSPDSRNTWLVSETSEDFLSLVPLCSKESKKGLGEDTIFKNYSLGVSTNRDRVLVNFSIEQLSQNAEKFITHYNAEVDRFKREWKNYEDKDKKKFEGLDEFLKISDVKWSRNLKNELKRHKYMEFDANCIKQAMYRPFTKIHLYFQDIAVDESGQFRRFFPESDGATQNQVICVPTVGFRDAWSALVTDKITDLHFTSGDGNQCFPFYVYDEDGTNRRENITDWAFLQFRSHYTDDSITKWDIFHYVYGVLHQPEYRETFGENLKLELPRIPFMEDFRAFAEAGRELGGLHVGYESVEPWPLQFDWAEGEAMDYRVERMKLDREKTTLFVNPSLSLAEIPPEAHDYRLGNRSALEWVIDQYRVKADPRSGITSDPNRPDDPEAIVRLVGQVVRVSVETARIVSGLPTGIGEGPGVGDS